MLTKLDVCDDPDKLVEAEAIAVGVPVLPVSNVTGEGLDAVRALLQPAKTFVLLGSSGTGKSTLANRLAGRTVMEIGDLRNDGRGRHTTRHRQLLMMPGGAILIDTPGLRELQVWEGDLDSAFADIAELAVAVPVQRLRAFVRARLCGARGAFEIRRARPRPVAELRQAAARAPRDRGEEQPPDPARAQEPLAGACSRDAPRSPLRRQALGRPTSTAS